jgi:hypothetical protein
MIPNKIEMKKFFLILLLIGSFNIQSQNYVISMYDTVKYGNCGDLLLPTVTFSNTSANPVQMHFHRILKAIPTGWTSCFCAPSCIAQTLDSLNFTIPNGGTKNNPNTQNVSPNFGTDSIPGIGEVIVVFNEIGVNHYDTIHFRGITSKLAGIETFEKNESFLISPNPFTDFISIKNFGEQIKAIQLFDINGKEIYKSNCQSLQLEFKVRVTDFPAGQYFLLIQRADNSVFRKKIVKIQ